MVRIKKSQRILVICPFPQAVAAGQRLKYEQYFPDWESEGYQIVVSSFMDAAMWRVVYTKGNLLAKIAGTFRGFVRRIADIFRLPFYDVVYVFMWVTPIGTSFYERIYRLLSKRLIYDIEDSSHIEKSNEYNPIVKHLKSKHKTTYLVKVADHVITSSPFLNDFCLGLNLKKRCTFITSSVDTDRFLPVERYNNEQKVVIGWTGTFSSKPYLDLIREVLVDLARRCDFKLVVIGNFQYQLPGVDLEVIQWTSEHEVTDLQKIDIGLYPLPDNEWVLGKSGLKAIQYMAFGLPTVATSVGNTPNVIQHLENGWLVKSHAEWVDALEQLLKDPALRKRLGQAARQAVLKNFSKQAVKSTYMQILRET
jgi:glycosyltransferase involved in cell wall biosynthesis